MIYYRENRSIIPAGLGPCMTYILNFKLILLAALITVGLRNVADQLQRFAIARKMQPLEYWFGNMVSPISREVFVGEKL